MRIFYTIVAIIVIWLSWSYITYDAKVEYCKREDKKIEQMTEEYFMKSYDFKTFVRKCKYI